MYQRIIDAIGLLLLGKEYIGGIVQEGDKEKPVYVLDSIFPNQEIQVLAHKAMLDGGMSKMRRRDKAVVDRISATIILQDFMESRAYDEMKKKR